MTTEQKQQVDLIIKAVNAAQEQFSALMPYQICTHENSAQLLCDLATTIYHGSTAIRQCSVDVHNYSVYDLAECVYQKASQLIIARDWKCHQGVEDTADMLKQSLHTLHSLLQQI